MRPFKKLFLERRTKKHWNVEKNHSSRSLSCRDLIFSYKASVARKRLYNGALWASGLEARVLFNASLTACQPKRQVTRVRRRGDARVINSWKNNWRKRQAQSADERRKRGHPVAQFAYGLVFHVYVPRNENNCRRTCVQLRY